MKKKQKKILPDEISEEAIAKEADAEEEISETAPDEEIPEENFLKKGISNRAEGDPGEEKKKAMEEDIELFHSLFPEITSKDIPEEVWQRVEDGESLAASFALYFVKNAKEEERIRALNEKNEKKAPPKICDDGREADYFSPEAVKGMTRGEIKKNYKAILRSMDSWK